MTEEINILPPPNREPEYEPSYEDRVGLMIMKMPVGSVFEIAKSVKPENTDKFIATVKSYIDRDFGKRERWEIYFNKEHTKIIKTEHNSHYTPKA